MADALDKITGYAEEDLEKRLAKVYEQAFRDLDRKFNAYMELTKEKRAEMKERWSNGDITRTEYMQWSRREVLGGRRWLELQQNIAKDLYEADKRAVEMTNEHSKSMYAEGMNYGTYQAEHDAQVNTSFSLYDKPLVEKLVKEEPNLLPLKEVDGRKSIRWNRQHVSSAITQGVLQGEPIPDIAKRLMEVTGMGYRAAVRNARTATISASNKGKLDSYDRAKQMGIQLQKQWIATLDNRTRDTHRELDGQTVDDDEPFVTSDGYELMYPADPDGEPSEVYNCRCTMRAVIKGLNEDSYDWRRDTEIDGQSYDEWKEGHSKAEVSQMPNPESQREETVAELIERIKRENERSGFSKPSEEQTMEVGKAVANDYKKSEIYSRPEREIAEAKAKYESAEKAVNDYGEPFNWTFYKGSPEELKIDELIDAYHKAEKDYYNLVDNVYFAKADAFKEYLSQFRDMGSAGLNVKAHLNNSGSVMRPVVEWAYNHYPTAWVQRSIGEGNLTPKKVERGFYSHWRSIIAISGDPKRWGAYDTALHELGHRFEHIMPNILAAEQEFYDRRTAGEELEWLGQGYTQDELTRKDDFIHPYMGKDYNGNAFELVSMGFQRAFMNPEELAKDPDMEAWIYGLLALY